jgi:hypothetical protein
MNATESPVGTWTMIGLLDQAYATITLVRRGAELGYRATIVEGATSNVIGYYRSLRAAAKASHGWFTSTRGSTGKPHAGWLPARPER